MFSFIILELHKCEILYSYCFLFNDYARNFRNEEAAELAEEMEAAAVLEEVVSETAAGVVSEVVAEEMVLAEVLEEVVEEMLSETAAGVVSEVEAEEMVLAEVLEELVEEMLSETAAGVAAKAHRAAVRYVHVCHQIHK